MTFGLRVQTDLALPGLLDAPHGLPLALTGPAPGAGAGFSGPLDPPEVGRATVDGRAWTVERGTEGDLLLRWGDAGTFHLAGSRLLATGDAGDPAWQRVVLDSVLTTAVLARGFEALHAAVVAVDARGAVALVGGRGAGKTSTALALLRAGGLLVADDVGVLSREDAAAVHPGPRVMNVPTAAASAAPADGRVLADFGDERWIELPAHRCVTAPLTLRSVVVLDRTAPTGTAPVMAPVAFPAPALLAHALDSGAGRRAARFARLADLADAVPVLTLRAPADAPPDALAALLRT